jgi:hypothetical protein
VVQFGKDNMAVHFYDFLVENKKRGKFYGSSDRCVPMR